MNSIPVKRIHENVKMSFQRVLIITTFSLPKFLASIILCQKSYKKLKKRSEKLI